MLSGVLTPEKVKKREAKGPEAQIEATCAPHHVGRRTLNQFRQQLRFSGDAERDQKERESAPATDPRPEQ